ncbi:MAG: fibronectin type III domain-containing protein [Thermoleophilia bacterium]
MSKKRKVHIKFLSFTLVPVVLLLMAIIVGTQAQALDATQWEKVRGYIASYYGGPQSGGGLDGEAGFRMGKVALWNRLDSNGDIQPNAGTLVGSAGAAVTGVAGEGDDMANRPVLIDNLMTQTAFIPGTEFRCNWNVDQSCFSDSSITMIRELVDAHAAAGFSTDIVDHCVSSQTAGPVTGGFGIIAQVPGALSSNTLLIPKVYIADYSRNGWRNNLVTAPGTGATASPEISAGGFAAPSTVADCDTSATDLALVECQANWAIASTKGNVSNGSTDLTAIGNAGQSVDIRTGTITTMSSAGTNLQAPINTLFSVSGLASLDPTASTVVASRTQMGATTAIGLKMLGYNMIPGGSINAGISRWNGTLGEQQVAYGDGLPLQSVAAYTVPAKVDTTPPTITVNPSASVIGTTTATISRTAAEPATMKVEYGTTTGVYTTTVNNTVLNAVKSVGLTGLTPSTMYYVKVTSYDGQANGAVSSEFSFTTAGVNDRYYYLPWYDSTTSDGLSAWICIANMTNHAITGVEVNIGGTSKGTQDIPSGGHLELKYDNAIGGPAFVRIPAGITSGDKLTVSERTLYKNSFNENLAVDKADAGSSYAFTWYDNNAGWGMMGDWIGIVNVDTTDAIVDVYINDMVTPAITRTVTPGAVSIFQMPTTITSGPVKVVAQGGKKIITSQRVLYLNSFNEIMGDKLL